MTFFLNCYVLVLIPRPLARMFADDHTFFVSLKGYFGELMAVKDVKLGAMLLRLWDGGVFLLELEAHCRRGW